MVVPTNRAVSIAIILTELVTNAAKHAFAEGAAGAIRVQLKADGAGGLPLLVADDGPGRPPGFSAADSRGLGMRIALALTQQLGGRKALEHAISNIVPMGRFATAEEIAEVILFMVSDRSSYMTGQTINVNGGMYMS